MPMPGAVGGPQVPVDAGGGPIPEDGGGPIPDDSGGPAFEYGGIELFGDCKGGFPVESILIFLI